MDNAQPGQAQFLQLCAAFSHPVKHLPTNIPHHAYMNRYVNSDREKTKRFVQHAEERGIKALFITVDAPQLGRREKDMRMKFEDEGSNVQKEAEEQVVRDQGAARAISVIFLCLTSKGEIGMLTAI